MSQSCDETYEAYVETWRKARKEHTCSACRTAIGKGHLYTKVFGCSRDSLESLKRCAACQTLHLHLRVLCKESEQYDVLWPDERLACGLDYEEEWGEIPEEIQKLAFMTPDEVQAARPWEEREV